MKNEHLTIGELLELYPNGFSVAPGATIQKTIFASSHFVLIARNHPVAPSNGGYLVVEGVRQGDSHE